MFPFRFELAETGLEVKLWSWTVRRVAYRDMESVDIGTALWNEHWTNVWPWEFITIRRKSGLVKNFVINPGDRERFIMDLRMKMLSGQ